MGGRELWEYLQDEYPGISDTRIANLAGVTSSAVCGWKFGDHRPEYDKVRRLHQRLCDAYPYRGSNEIRLLSKAGYDLPPDPKVERLRRFTREWAEITAELVQKRPHVKWRAIEAVARGTPSFAITSEIVSGSSLRATVGYLTYASRTYGPCGGAGCRSGSAHL